MSRHQLLRAPRSMRTTFLTATAMTIMSGAALASDGDANDVLLKKMEKMEQRIQSLEAELKQKRAAPAPASAKPALASPKSADAAIAPDQPAGAGGASEAAPIKPSTPSPAKPILGLAVSPVPGLTIGAYGEIKFVSVLYPAANRQWQNSFYAHRIV